MSKKSKSKSGSSVNRARIPEDRMSSALRSLMRLTGCENVNLSLAGSVLTMRGAGPSSSGLYRVDVEASEKAEMSITVESGLLASMLDKRKDIEVEAVGSSLFVRAKRYEAEIVGTEDQPVLVIPKEILRGADGIELDDRFMKHIVRVLPRLELKPLLSTYSEVPIGIRATKQGTFLACFDFVQSATTRLEKRGDFQFMLPSVSQFNNLTKEMSGQDYKIVITDSVLYCWSELVQLALSLPQQDGEQVRLEDVEKLVSDLESVKFAKMTMVTDDLRSFLSNSRHVYDRDSVFTVRASGEMADLSLQATVGNARGRVRLKKSMGDKKLEFKCDLNFFSNIVSKATGKTVTLRVSPEILRLEDNDVSYLMSLV